jgi:hypothetical protein
MKDLWWFVVDAFRELAWPIIVVTVITLASEMS